MNAASTEDIPEVDAHLIGLWIQILVTGIYFSYLPRCTIILTRKLRNGLSPWLPLACVLIFAGTIQHRAQDFVVGLIRAYEAYRVRGTGEADPYAVYGDNSSTLSLMKNAMNVVVAIISDVIIVHRTYMVWNRSTLAVLAPVGLLIGDTAVGIWAVWTLAQTDTGSDAILAVVSVRVRYFFIITFVLNLLCSGMICFKIWRIQAMIPSVSSARPRLGDLTVTTAGLYCAHLFILIVTNCVGTNFFFLFLDPLPAVGAYVFTLIIVRGARANTAYSDSSLSTTTPSINFRATRRSRSGRPTVSLGVEIDLEHVGDTANVDSLHRQDASDPDRTPVDVYDDPDLKYASSRTRDSL
ncbi:hypothetical protein BD414DRAFT_422788 [Trametes punicea]|nr:hypothetical protein BD414DRAFT_422788 [Trametes punicea]